MDRRKRGMEDVCTPLLVDVTVPCPTCASYVGNSALASNFAAREAHDTKFRKYQRFVPGSEHFAAVCGGGTGRLHGDAV